MTIVLDINELAKKLQTGTINKRMRHIPSMAKIRILALIESTTTVNKRHKDKVKLCQYFF